MRAARNASSSSTAERRVGEWRGDVGPVQTQAGVWREPRAQSVGHERQLSIDNVSYRPCPVHQVQSRPCFCPLRWHGLTAWRIFPPEPNRLSWSRAIERHIAQMISMCSSGVACFLWVVGIICSLRLRASPTEVWLRSPSLPVDIGRVHAILGDLELLPGVVTVDDRCMTLRRCRSTIRVEFDPVDDGVVLMSRVELDGLQRLFCKLMDVCVLVLCPVVMGTAFFLLAFVFVPHESDVARRHVLHVIHLLHVLWLPLAVYASYLWMRRLVLRLPEGLRQRIEVLCRTLD